MLNRVDNIGSPDTSAGAMLLDADGHLLLAGRGGGDFAVARVTAGGTLDAQHATRQWVWDPRRENGRNFRS